MCVGKPIRKQMILEGVCGGKKMGVGEKRGIDGARDIKFNVYQICGGWMVGPDRGLERRESSGR
jgi:hypothetical protein